MRDDYQFKSATDKIQVELEKEVIEALKKMESHTKLSASELTNVALKRFIVAHKDFFPPQEK